MTAQEHSEVELASIVATRARGLLAERQMKQGELSLIMGITRSRMSDRLNGVKDFDLNEMPRLSAALGTSIEYLMGLTEQRAPSTVVDEAPALVRHEGLEPPTRWFAARSQVLSVPGGIQEPVAQVALPEVTVEPLEQLATVLPFHRPTRGRLLEGGPRPRPRPRTEQAS